jgi:hypothetical protein
MRDSILYGAEAMQYCCQFAPLFTSIFRHGFALDFYIFFTLPDIKKQGIQKKLNYPGTKWNRYGSNQPLCRLIATSHGCASLNRIQHSARPHRAGSIRWT